MLKSMSIGNRLFVSFGGMFLLILLVGTGLTAYAIITLSASTTKLYNHPLTVSNAVRDVYINVVNIRVCMKDVALARDRASLETIIQRINTYEEDIQQDFEIIQERYLGNPQNVEHVMEIFAQWKPVREEIFDLKRAGKDEETVQAVNEGQGNQHFLEMENAMKVLIDFASAKASTFLANFRAKTWQVAVFTFLIICLLVVVGITIVVMVARTITQPLRGAVRVVEQVAEGSLDVNFPVINNDEIGQLLRSMQKMIAYIQNVADITEKISKMDLNVEVSPKSDRDVLNHSLQRMVSNLQTMMEEINKSIEGAERQNWVKDGINQLSMELSGEMSLAQASQKAVSFIARQVNAGHGVLYVYNVEKDILELQGTFAFTEKDTLSKEIRLGEGVAGQAARERTPILLKNITRQNTLINTATTSEAPLNTYTFPLVYDNNLYGILELATSEQFDAIQQSFVDATNQIIATTIFSALQRDRIQELFRTSEQTAQEAVQAKVESQEQMRKVEEANRHMEEQQQQLQQQNEELQQLNAQMKEQQQQLEQQREELRQQKENLVRSQEALERRTQELEAVKGS